VTGSNSKFLSSDIITEFRGRGDEIRVYPLSFSEFSSVYKEKTTAWNDYYTYGGLPLILLQNSDEAKMDYLSSQAKNVYLNDVIERNNVQSKEALASLVEIISSGIGSLTNPTKLYNTFKSKLNIAITDKTIHNYLNYLEKAFLIEKSKRYDVKGKKYIGTPLKYYFTDLGIRNSLLNFRQQEESHIMENIIYIELRRRGFNVDVGVVGIRERKDDTTIRKQLEIDFIANKGNNKIYIQSALDMPTKEKVEQEQRSLLNVDDNFKKVIIVKDDIKRKRDENGLITMGVFDFLLDIHSLDY
jgi:predicted AAA+ superfamily ATPase